MIKVNIVKFISLIFIALLLILFVDSVFASKIIIGDVAKNVTTVFPSLAKLLTGASYVASMVLFIASMMKFKQYSAAPTQIHIAIPCLIFLIAVLMWALPSFILTSGTTLFGEKFYTAGPSGIVLIPGI